MLFCQLIIQKNQMLLQIVEHAHKQALVKASDLHQVAVLSWLAFHIMTLNLDLFLELQIMVAIAEKQRRPVIPPESELPGGSFPALPAYLDLMQACWDSHPQQRPNFESCIITLRGLLEQAMATKYALPPSPPLLFVCSSNS